jgi:MFS transporter, DHA1 family, tetracycline resistance protein
LSLKLHRDRHAAVGLVSGNLGLTPRQAAYFFIYFSVVTLATNLLFFQTLVKYVNQRTMLIGVAAMGVGVMALYAFVGSSIPMLYVAGAVDAVSVSLLAGLISDLTSDLVSKSAGQGSVFGDTQALGGVFSFGVAVMTTLLTALEPRAPFAFYALAFVVIAYRTTRLPKEAAKHVEEAGPER